MRPIPFDVTAFEPSEDASGEEVLRAAGFAAEALTKSIAGSVDPRDISTKAKVPFKTVYLAELLLHRAAELSTAACELAEKDRIVSAFTLVRGFVETTVVLWSLEHRIGAALRTKDLEGLNDYLNRGLHGSRVDPGLPKAVNVLTLIDEASKSVPELRRAYDELCEFAHPNWSGLQGSFALIDRERSAASLGASKVPLDIGFKCLLAATGMLILAYNSLAAMVPELVSICEVALARGRG